MGRKEEKGDEERKYREIGRVRKEKTKRIGKGSKMIGFRQVRSEKIQKRREVTREKRYGRKRRGERTIPTAEKGTENRREEMEETGRIMESYDRGKRKDKQEEMERERKNRIAVMETR